MRANSEMLKESVSIDEVVEYLNSVIAADANAMRAMLCVRIPCNSNLADHPSTQVDEEWKEGYTVGFMGILNGIFGVLDNGYGGIAYEFSEGENSLVKFIRTPTQDDV